MRTTLLSAALLAAFTSSATAQGRPAGADKLCEREMIAASQRHGVPLGMLYAVGLTETGRGDSLRPYALNVDGKAVYELSRQEAVRAFNTAMRNGARLIDVGCMQINHRYHRQHFASVETMLDPVVNVDYAARYLAQLKVREGTWTLAVARYHAGPDNDPAQKRYVCRVISNMVATGFGKWTPESEKFCGVRVVNDKARRQ
ncbi:MAG: lytic transglycosylase domain-containing protein [Hyphomicrobiaceae bacterium]|nr:lytic transglycosylase domain-containing protein [Hyphomicrobiaceae bacterium]